MAHQPKGAFVPTTNVWDVSEIYNTEVGSQEFKELLVRLYQNLNNISVILNIKDSGYYNTQPFVTGQLFFPVPGSSTVEDARYRPTVRKVINFGALPNAGAKSVAHGILMTSKTIFTRIYAAASDTSGNTYIPLPYASPTLVNNIELSVGSTNVTITTGSNRSNFNVCYVILEYLQV